MKNFSGNHEPVNGKGEQYAINSKGFQRIAAENGNKAANGDNGGDKGEDRPGEEEGNIGRAEQGDGFPQIVACRADDDGHAGKGLPAAVGVDDGGPVRAAAVFAAGTDIRMHRYLIFKLLQGIVASLVATALVIAI